MTPHNSDKQTKAYVGLQNPGFPSKWKDRFGSWDGTLDRKTSQEASSTAVEEEIAAIDVERASRHSGLSEDPAQKSKEEMRDMVRSIVRDEIQGVLSKELKQMLPLFGPGRFHAQAGQVLPSHQLTETENFPQPMLAAAETLRTAQIS